MLKFTNRPTVGEKFNFPFRYCKDATAFLKTPEITGLPPLTGGFVGYLGYDAIRRLEKIPNIAKKDLDIPELEFMLATDLAVLDHAEGTIYLIANAVNWDGSDARVDEVYQLAADMGGAAFIFSGEKSLMAPNWIPRHDRSMDLMVASKSTDVTAIRVTSAPSRFAW